MWRQHFTPLRHILRWVDLFKYMWRQRFTPLRQILWLDDLFKNNQYSSRFTWVGPHFCVYIGNLWAGCGSACVHACRCEIDTCFTEIEAGWKGTGQLIILWLVDVRSINAHESSVWRSIRCTSCMHNTWYIKEDWWYLDDGSWFTREGLGYILEFIICKGWSRIHTEGFMICIGTSWYRKLMIPTSILWLVLECAWLILECPWFMH